MSDFILNFPFESLLDTDRIWRLDLETCSFHSIECGQNNYIFEAEAYSENGLQKCENLKYNQDLKKILDTGVSSKKFLNFKFMSINQKNNELREKNEKINDGKLEYLNLKRDNLRLVNRQSDCKRFICLLAQNDISRVHQLIKSCLSQKVKKI